MQEITLRPAGPDDGPGIQRLLASVFPENPKANADVMRWQYWDNPFGQALSWICEDEGKIVCHFASVPIPLIVDGRKEVGALGVDGATAKTHRGRGLYHKVTAASYSDCCKRGIEIQLIFRDRKSVVPWDITLTAEHAGSLKLFVMPTNDQWLADRMRVPRPFASAVRRVLFRVPKPAGNQVEGLPPDVDDLWNRIEPRNPYGVIQNGAWWDWRYAAHPDAPYLFFEVRSGTRLSALAAVRIRDDQDGRVAYVLDLLAEDGDGARALFGTLAVNLEVSGVAFRALSGSEPARHAQAAGLRSVPARIEPNSVSFYIRNTCLKPHEHSAARWPVTWSLADSI